CGAAAEHRDRSRECLYRVVGGFARSSDWRAQRDHALNHLGIFAGQLARIDSAETLADYDDWLFELFVGESEPRVQFAHRLARTFGVGPDSAEDYAMTEPSEEIRHRGQRDITGNETWNP